MSINTQLSALGALCRDQLAAFPEKIKRGAATAVQTKIEIVRREFYANSASLGQGIKSIKRFIDNICTLATKREQNDLLKNVPKKIFLSSFEPLAGDAATVDSVLKRLTAIAKALQLPEERIGTFPQKLVPAVRKRVVGEAKKVEGFAKAALYKCAVQQELSRLEKRWKEIYEAYRTYMPYFDKVSDPLPLAKTLLDTLAVDDQQDKMYHTYRTLLMSRSKAGCLDQFSFGQVMEFSRPDPSETIKGLEENLRKHVFTAVIRPSAHVAFCRELCKKGYTFSQLLGVYGEFIRSWQDVSEYSLEEAKNLLNVSPPEVEPLSLHPTTKTQIFVDAHAFCVHLKPVNRAKLYQTIALDHRLENVDYTSLESSIAHNGAIVHGVRSLSNVQGESGALLNDTITFSRAASIGRRDAMEDVDLITTITLMDGEVCPLFAIMDGHGGPLIAHILKQCLAPTVTSWLNAALQEKIDVDIAFRNALKIGMKQLNVLIKNMTHPHPPSGSCAIFSFIYKDLLFTVNVGDSRGLTSTGQQLNREANQYSPEYVKKIKKRGGKINNQGRICDSKVLLNTFSAFADFDNPYVDAFAAVHVLKLTPVENGRPMRLLLACDGITARLTSQRLIWQLQVDATAKELVQLAYSEGAEDNLTAIVAEIPYTV